MPVITARFPIWISLRPPQADFSDYSTLFRGSQHRLCHHGLSERPFVTREHTYSVPVERLMGQALSRASGVRVVWRTCSLLPGRARLRVPVQTAA